MIYSASTLTNGSVQQIADPTTVPTFTVDSQGGGNIEGLIKYQNTFYTTGFTLTGRQWIGVFLVFLGLGLDMINPKHKTN